MTTKRTTQAHKDALWKHYEAAELALIEARKGFEAATDNLTEYSEDFAEANNEFDYWHCACQEAGVFEDGGDE